MYTYKVSAKVTTIADDSATIDFPPMDIQADTPYQAVKRFITAVKSAIPTKLIVEYSASIASGDNVNVFAGTQYA